jgi:hypothetical protein
VQRPICSWALLEKKRGTLRQECPAMMEAQGIEPWSE